MKYKIQTWFFLLLGLMVINSCTQKTEVSFTRKINFDTDWKFHYGELSNVFESDLNLAEWQNIDLPHDWSVTLPFSKSNVGGTATGFSAGGTGWYVKKFRIEPEQLRKQLSLYFEGSYMETEVWLNGEKIIFHPYGYTGFYCTINSFLKEEENMLAVKVSNNGKNSRWYSGSGIYRHVWLEETDPVHIEKWGIYITTPEISEEKAMVNISVSLLNETSEPKTIDLDFIVSDSASRTVGRIKTPVSLNPGEKTTIVKSLEIPKPVLWSVNSPVLYSSEVTIKTGNKLRDKIITPFGIRTISFSAEKGFLLNGQPLKLKGGCIHHDNGLLGAVAIDRAEERKVELLKSNGFNAVRCAHNPPSEKFLEACDRLGLLVIDEAFDQWQKPKNPDDYHRFFDEWNEKDFASMLLRDRNHPSIIMWSIGNEIKERADTNGLRIAKNFRRLVNEYDPTRPITLAVNDFWDNPGYTWKDNTEKTFEQVDICGYNYTWWQYEKDHEQFPDRIIFGSESTASESALNWDLVEQHPYVIGDFVWTAMDYLGETGIGHTSYVKKLSDASPFALDYPCYNAWCGDIDICGNKKPQILLRDVLWGNSKIEMLVHSPVPQGLVEKVSYWGWPDELPSWTWQGCEGEMLDVRVFSRYSSVRLYLNGNLIGEKESGIKNPGKYVASFKVKYEPGDLKAVGIENGEEKENIILKTSGEPVKINLIADRQKIYNTRNDLSYIQIQLTDKDGNLVTAMDRKVELVVTGEGELAAAGNAAPDAVESFRSSSPMTFRGRALAILRPKGQTGTITLTVKSSGMPDETINIDVVRSNQIDQFINGIEE